MDKRKKNVIIIIACVCGLLLIGTAITLIIIKLNKNKANDSTEKVSVVQFSIPEKKLEVSSEETSIKSADETMSDISIDTKDEGKKETPKEKTKAVTSEKTSEKSSEKASEVKQPADIPAVIIENPDEVAPPVPPKEPDKTQPQEDDGTIDLPFIPYEDIMIEE